METIQEDTDASSKESGSLASSPIMTDTNVQHENMKQSEKLATPKSNPKHEESLPLDKIDGMALAIKSTSSSTLYVESEQKLDDMDEKSTNSRPMSAGRKRTPPVGEDVQTPDPEIHEVTNTRNLVAFDSDLRDSYPDRSDAETDAIIQKLRKTLSTPAANDPDAESIFPTSVPEETLEEARKRQQRRQLEREARMWDSENAPRRRTMQEVIDEKVEEHFNRGVELSSEGRFEAAISSFTKAINLQPNNVECFVERAEAFVQLCDFRSAHLNYKRAFALEPHNPDLFDKLAFVSYMEGQCLFDQGLYSEALESFTRAAEMKPSISGYHMRTVACLASLGRNQECLALVTRRLESETTVNPELYVLRARLHRMFNNATLCYYDVRDALSLDSEQPEALQMMREIRQISDEAKQQAVSLTIQGKLHEALKRIGTAVSTDPSIAEYHVFRGALHRRMQNFNSAIDDYLLAMDKSDHNEQDRVYLDAQRQLLLTYNDFAVYCYHREFYEEAIVLLNKAIKGEKTEKGLYLNRGDCFFKIEDFGFALADYQQSLEIDPACWDTRCRIAVVHNEFGILAYQDRQYLDAVQRFSLAVEHNGKVGQFYVHRARARYLMHEVDEAREDILLAIHLDPNNDEIIPLLSRLFPGRSVKEVMQSQAAVNARESLSAVLSGPPTAAPSLAASRKTKTPKTALQPPGTSQSGGSLLQDETASLVDDRLTTAETVTPVPRKIPTDAEIIMEKKQVAEDLKNIFRFPKTLKYNGPKVATSATLAPKRPMSPGDGNKRRGYNWRKFNMKLAPV